MGCQEQFQVAVVEQPHAHLERGEDAQSLLVQIAKPQVAIRRTVVWFWRGRQAGVTRKGERKLLLQIVQSERRQCLRVLRSFLDGCGFLGTTHLFFLRERRSAAFWANARR